jgi:hypothetical protein
MIIEIENKGDKSLVKVFSSTPFSSKSDFFKLTKQIKINRVTITNATTAAEKQDAKPEPERERKIPESKGGLKNDWK